MSKFLLLLLFALIHNVQNARACKWVCVDKNNNIKKEFINGRKIALNPQNKREISVTKEFSNLKKKEAILKSPEVVVESNHDMCSTSESLKTIKEMAKKIKCKPRETIVDIKYRGRKVRTKYITNLSYKIRSLCLQVIPGKVTTKLCSGFCSGSSSCIATETANVSLSVSIPDSSGRLQCSVVQVPEDVKCKCGCDKKLFDCNKKQAFDKKFCKCKCTNEEEKRSCLSKMKNGINKYYWSKEECFCKCRNEFVCTTGTRWDHEICRCVKMEKQK
ncbi:unnamed protein product [Phyllotreta striolata]|uniref:Platelet-derived growth factor (PDGF) family profile domain-containing protein n=1 Tax=Phyllotreta striolata TaxID=444603 RepID=A0A9N9TDQ9_PHYSR|nr:unnamed protein product [Phyllotreta striolata]